MDAGQMFERMFGDAVGAEQQIVVWTRQDKQSRWHKSTGSAADDVRRLSDSGLDVYFGCALQDPDAAMAEARRRANAAGAAPPGSLTHVRGSRSSARAIGGIWIDVDVASTEHKKPDLPQSMEAALNGIDLMPIKPSLVIQTGGGLHAWWLFREPWELASVADRESATRRVFGWQAAARALADWKSLDSTHDLARVLRPVGTRNYKIPGHPRDVIALRAEFDSASNPSDFELWEQDPGADPVRVNLPQIGHVGPVKASAVQVPPAVIALDLTDARFHATWERMRRDLDGSPSAYDMSIAIQLAKVGCDPQTIADAILAWRIKHDADPRKAMRAGYLALTIGKAMQRVDRARAEAVEVSGSPADMPPISEATVEQEAIEDSERFTRAVSVSVERGQMRAPQVVAALLRDLNELLPDGSKIERFSKVGNGAAAVYFARFEGDPPNTAPARIGSVGSLLAQSMFRAFVAAERGKLMPMLEAKRWEPILRGILASIELPEPAPELTATEAVRHVVEGYLESRRNDLQAQIQERDRVNGPTRAQGKPTVLGNRTGGMRVAVTPLDIQNEMRRRGVRIAGAETLVEIAGALGALGFERREAQFVLRGQARRTAYYAAPQELSASVLGEAGGYAPQPDVDVQPEDADAA